MSRFQFVDDHRDAFEVKRLCGFLGLNRSSYYKWRAGREARDAGSGPISAWRQGSAWSTPSPAVSTAHPG